jgi:hypothetical protein
MAANTTGVDHGRLNGDNKFEAKHFDEKGSDRSASSDDEEFTPQEQRKIIHRIDRRLVLTTGIMYCVSLMDRINLGQASIAGMQVELRLNVGFRYVSSDAGHHIWMLTTLLYSSLSLYWSSSSPMSSFSPLPPLYAARLDLDPFCPSSRSPGEWSWYDASHQFLNKNADFLSRLGWVSPKHGLS